MKMEAKIIDGKRIADEIKEGLKTRISKLNFTPGLAVIIMGEDPASRLYVKKKIEACGELGIYSEKHALPDNVTEEEVIALIGGLNSNQRIHGILVQLPLPKHINAINVINQIKPLKDVDGLHPLNMGKIFTNDSSAFISATPKGIIRLLDEEKGKSFNSHYYFVS